MSTLRERLDLVAEREGASVIQEHLARYEFASGFVSGKNVLDIACGTGYGVAMLRKAGAAGVCGADLSQGAIDAANKSYGGDGIQFVAADAESFMLGARYDVITSFETIEHLQHPDRFLQAVLHHLAPGGTFIVSTPARYGGTLESKPDNPFHVREWSAGEFYELLKPLFREISMYGQYALVKWPFPYSRTLQRKVLGLFKPQVVTDLDRYPVLRQAPRTPALFPSTVAYCVAVCTR